MPCTTRCALLLWSRGAEHDGHGEFSEDNYNQDQEEDGEVIVLGDVPLEVVAGILQALDPVSLAAAARVCR